MHLKNLRILLIAVMVVLLACSRQPQRPQEPKTEPASQPSTIKVDVNANGPVVLTTSTAQFQVRPDGNTQAFLLKDGQKLSLDEPQAGVAARRLRRHRWKEFTSRSISNR
jgi:hypothetical protein